MKIAIVSRVVFLSGVSTHIYDLCAGLVDRGHEVFLLTVGPQYPQMEENVELFNKILNLGVTYIKVDFPVNSRRKILYLKKMFNSFFELKNIFKREKFDVIHVHTPSVSFIPALAGLKYVKTRHIANQKIFPFDLKATHEIAVSQDVYNEYKNRFHYDETQISLIHNGVDISFSNKETLYVVDGVRQRLNIPKDKIVIGLVGTITYRKGHDILLKAIDSLEKSLREKILLLFLGSGDREGMEYFNESLSMNNIKSNEYIQINFQKNPKAYYNIIDVFVLPSRREAFPLAVIEAMLSGCLVVRSDTEGANEQIKNGKTGFLFKSEESKQLAEILSKVVMNFSDYHKIIDNGRNFALQHFTSDRMVDKTIEVYKKVLNNE